MSTFKVKYKRFLDSDETEVYTGYHALISKKPDGTHVFRQFFPETGQITHYFHYNMETGQKNGPYKEWYDDGTLVTDGQYKDGKEVGEWYISSSKGIYNDGKKEGEWKLMNKKGQVSASYHYTNNKKDGKFIEYDSLGTVENEGIYRADTIFSETRQKKSVTEREDLPRIASCTEGNKVESKKCSDSALYGYLLKNLRYPDQARLNGVIGDAIVQFEIDIDGSINNVTVLRGLCQSIKDEALRMIANMPPWNPGYQNGKPVKVLYTLPLKFRLE
jgi:TonB family protein